MQDQSAEIVISTSSIDILYLIRISVDYVNAHIPDLIYIGQKVIGFLIGLSIPVSLLLFIGIIFTVERLKMIRIKEDAYYSKKKEEPAPSKGNPEIARKWDNVLIHIESPNPNDWRQAIIEADIILGDLLVMLGYKGAGIGEQLKRVTKAEFKSLDDAWEAHKVRNEIAHAGSDFPLNQYDARRVVQLYRKVFEEFFHI